MLKVVLIALGACSALLIACNGDSTSCNAPSKCPADPRPTLAGIASCQALSKDSCGTEYVDLNNCAQINQTCTPAGTTDQTATFTACAAEVAAYSNCCSANKSACGNDGGT